MKKSVLSFLMIFCVLLGFSVPAMAAGTDFTDVAADAWYAEAVAYCRENGIMSGTGSSTFSPETTLSRAMLATILWRVDGSPIVTATHTFTDVASGQWYSNAIAWAASEGIISGYSPQTFGTNDPVTREQTATLLYRYAEYKGVNAEVSSELDFADRQSIASWAAAAVTWTNENNIISGWPGELFNPKNNTTRAEVADAIYRYLTANQYEPKTQANTEPELTGKTLVAYFSRTGNTEVIAGYVQELAGGDLFEIVTVNPYPSDYSECLSQATMELEQNFRPELSTHVVDMEQYDRIFIGYPIWWGNTPMAVLAFLEEYDFSGKTVIPFCTYGSSGSGQSFSSVKSSASGATVLDGFGCRGADASNVKSRVEQWINNLGVLD